MKLLGENLIGATSIRGAGEPFSGFDPVSQQPGQVVFYSATEAELERACELAKAAARPFADTSREDRALFLEKLADNLAASESDIVAQGMAETGLPEVRLSGELARTANQLRLFARVLRDGAYLDIRVDDALPERVPPRPDLRLMMQPLGPVAVFGASNFPLAFSVAGGDTASALAAGCPVIVKAHHGHPATSEIVGRIIQASVAECSLPDGTFSLLFGSGKVIGQGLVADPRIQAVGFTGSRAGGLALRETSNRRPAPIPVYSEMSAINPVVLLPGALRDGGQAIGGAFAQSQTMGAGQFCTNPGLLVAIEGPELDDFIAGVREAYQGTVPGVMLTPGIHAAYCAGVEGLATHDKVALLAQGEDAEGLTSRPALFGATAEDFLADEMLAGEVFGAASLLVRCANLDEVLRVVDALEGQLTGAIHTGDGDDAAARDVLVHMQARAGRVLFNGFGTGVEVADAMVHGGPFPATSDVRTTSVGSLAIARFLRPVCYQDTPEQFLPMDLRSEALATLPHRRNGELVLP